MMRAREGFTLVEVIISIVLLGIIIIMLGGLTLSTARQANINTNLSTRQTLSLDRMNRAATVPYAMLVVGTTCDTVGANAQPVPAGHRDRYQRCATVADRSGGREITITTKPLLRPRDSTVVRLTRASPIPPQNPLCTLGGC